MPDPIAVTVPLAPRLAEIAAVFSRLGCTAFGGPVAHLGYLHDEFVTRRNWLDDHHYSDLVALCQFLPGPASSQLVFALGHHRAGLPGAIVASACFTLPSALIMLAVAYGFARLPADAEPGWLHGLKVAAVAVVAQAVWTMGRRLCPDRLRLALGLGAAAAVLAFPGPLTPLVTLSIGGAVGAARYHDTLPASPAESEPTTASPHPVAAGALATFVALLVALPALAAATGARAIAVFDSFYRAGALVFGGGHVVLPMLRAEVVPRDWVTDDAFLAGYAAAQALPGPLFTFATYLGATMAPDASRAAYGVWCTLALFLPGWLLIAGALPFWQRLRAHASTHAVLAGANAAVVGILLAALCNPVAPEGLRDANDLAAAILAFGALEVGKAPSWSVVLLAAMTGQWLLG